MTPQAFTVSRQDAGQTVTAVLRSRLGLSWSQARRLVGARQVRLGGIPCLDPTRRVRTGQRLEVGSPGSVSPEPRQPSPRIHFADDQIVVVDKPSNLTTMRHRDEIAEFGQRARRYLPPTLADLLPPLLAAGRRGRLPAVRAVHRLDKDTSGLVVFARTPEAERHLGRQFRLHTVERRYLAVVRGRARDRRLESYLVRDRGDGRRGSTTEPGKGKRAVTHVRVVEDLGDFTLVECRLETGRTHQVRIHLGESGTPLYGDHIYDRPLHGRPLLPDSTGFPRPALHAASLGFEHPATGKHLVWQSPLPIDMAELVKRLRSARRSSSG